MSTFKRVDRLAARKLIQQEYEQVDEQVAWQIGRRVLLQVDLPVWDQVERPGCWRIMEQLEEDTA